MTMFFFLLAVLVGAMIYVVVRDSLAPGRLARQSLSDSENQLSNRYKDLVLLLPAEALAGETLSEERLSEYYDIFFRYYQLANEQVIRRKEGMVTGATWEKWALSITSTIELPAFRQARDQIFRGQRDRFFDPLILQARGSGYHPFVRRLAPS